VRSSQYGCFV